VIEDRASGRGHRYLVLASLMLATSIYATTMTIASVALPQIQGDLSASTEEIAWVITLNIVATAIATPPTGWIAARIGRKRLLLYSIAGFVLASLLCASATSLEELIVWRVLQGLLGAPLVPLSQAITLDTFPREQHGKATAIWSIGVMLGPILGPTVGGYLTDLYNWRYVFLVVIPFGVLSWFGTATFVQETERGRQSRFDFVGFLTLSIALAGLQLVLDRGQRLDWFDSREILGYAIAAGFGMYLFIAHSSTARASFIPLRIFADRNFSIGLLLMFVFGLLVFAPMVLIPLLLERYRGFPVTTIGFLLAPRGVGTMVAMLIVGQIVNRIDVRALLAIGFLGQTASTWMMAGFNLDVGMTEVFLANLLQGFGVGTLFVGLTVTTFATLAPELRTDGTAIFHLVRNIGSSIGVSSSVTVLARSAQINHAEMSQFVTQGNELARYGAIWPWDLATHTGLLAAEAEIERQAGMVAFVNSFWLMTLISLASLPLLALVRRPAAKP
jgi:MFS transporter, DHA2 family, multidrug resistance protein